MRPHNRSAFQERAEATARPQLPEVRTSHTIDLAYPASWLRALELQGTLLHLVLLLLPPGLQRLGCEDSVEESTVSPDALASTGRPRVRSMSP